MQYFDPPIIDKTIFNKAKIGHVEIIPIKPHESATALNCLNNVKNYISMNGGEIQLGWIFSIMGNLALKLTSHAVVKQTDGTLVCVTPNEYRNDKLKFAPDNSVEDLIQNNHLPMKFVALIASQTLNEYLDIEREMDKLRLDSSGLVKAIVVQQIQLKASMLYPAILELAKKHTGRNDYCFCGSIKKRKKCCA
jgi:HTH-type transcriptional repressor of NAD biosynthesis genes